MNDELKACLEKFNKIFSRIALKQSQKTEELKRAGVRLAEMKKKVLESLQAAEKRLELAEARLVEADKRYEKADKITQYFEEVADKEKKLLKNLVRKELRIKGENKAKERTLNDKRERLKIVELQIKDKQEALARVYREVKAKALKAGIVL